LSQAAAGEMLSSAGGSYQALIAFQSCLARFPAGVAQSAERLIRNEQVRGSIPLPGSFRRSVVLFRWSVDLDTGGSRPVHRMPLVISLNHGASEAVKSGFGELETELNLWRPTLEQRDLSPKTIRGYLEAGAQLVDFLEAQGMPTQVEHIRREHIEAFLIGVRNRTSVSTQATRYRQLQQLFKYLAEDEGVISTSPMARMQPPKLEEKEVATIPEGDLKKLLRACEGRDFAARRDLAIVRILLNTGARVGELVGTKLEDVDIDRREFLVLGKGRRARLLPLGPKAMRALIRYLRERDKHPHKDSPYLWLGIRGRLTESGVAQILERRCQKAGIGVINPHRFRHEFSHRYLVGGGAEHDLATLNGWASLQMVGRYAKSMAGERARAAHRRISPGDEL
jgi:site-specific recombinase XerD